MYCVVLLAGLAGASVQALDVQVTATPNPAQPLGVVTYAVTVSNVGASTVSAVTVDATIPGYTSATGITAGGTCAANNCAGGRTVTWSVGTMAAGAVRQVAFSVAVTNSATVPVGAQLTSTATAYEAGASSGQAQATVLVTSQPGLQLALAADRNPATPGTQVVYRLRYSNATSTVTANGLTATLPAGVSFVSASGGGTLSGNQVSWPLSVAPGVNGVRSFTVQVNAGVSNGTLLRTEASLSDSVSSSAAPAADVLAVTTVSPLVVAISALPDPTQPLGVVTYAVTVSNVGASTVSAVTVDATIPGYTSATGITAGGTCAANNCAGGRTVTWSVGTMAAGAVRQVAFSVAVTNSATVPVGAQLTSTATAYEAGASSGQAQATAVVAGTGPTTLRTLSGAVTDAATGQPVAGASVKVGNLVATSDATGHYSIVSVPATAYYVLASQANYQPFIVTITADQTGLNIPMVFAPSQCTGSGTLSGTVVDEGGKAVANLVVKLDGGPTSTTTGTGAYSFGSVGAGRHSLTASYSGYQPYTRAVTSCGSLTFKIQLVRETSVLGSLISTVFGDPVNTATGNYVYQHQDLSMPGKGMPFIFERTYNSRDPQNGPLGYGWTHQWNAITTVESGGNVTVRWGDGSTQTWAPNGSGGFTPQQSVFDTLTLSAGRYTVKKKDWTEYRFNAAQRLGSVVDKNGNAITLGYTGSNLTQITDTSGRAVTLIYDGSNRITDIADPLPRNIHFTYDGAGNLVTATNARNKTTTFSYDGNHQLLTIVDPRTHTVVTNTYDVAKRVVTYQSDARLGVTGYVYDPDSRITVITDALSNVTRQRYDDFLRLVEEVDALGHSSYFEYDAAGNRVGVTDKNGHLTTYSYDARGNVTGKVDALGQTTSIVYCPPATANCPNPNDPRSRTDAQPAVTSFTYDLKGNGLTVKSQVTANAADDVTTVTTPNPVTGQPDGVTDANNHVTLYRYDGAGERH